MKKILFVMVLLLALTACATNEAPRPESDSSQDYDTLARIPVDDNLYIISGEIVGELESNIRQVEPARGYYSAYGGFGSGAYYGPELSGKGLTRVEVFSIAMEPPQYPPPDYDPYASPGVKLAPVSSTIILKVTDLKGIKLEVGDRVTFKCRVQYEAIAAVRERSSFDADTVGTWEFDYCRLYTPQVHPGEPTQTPE